MNTTKANTYATIFFALFAILMTTAVKAGESDEAELREKIIKKMGPNIPIKSIKKTPYGSMYEVYMNDKLHYTDQDFSFMIVGVLVDIQKNLNYTKKSLRTIESISLSSLPPRKNAILTQKGMGQQTLYVFSDPLCKHCQKLEAHLQKMPKLTVYVYLVPNDRLNPGASRMASAIWCADNQATSYLNYMLKGIIPDTLGTCTTPFKTNQDIATKIGITGTPGLVFEDGYVITGTPNFKQLSQLLRESVAP